MFALIHNTQIEVGPREWNVAFFSDYLIENDLVSEISLLSRQAPTTVIEGTGWRIVSARIDVSPEFNPTFEQLVGPIWDIQATEVIGSYTKQDAALQIVKGHLLTTVVDNRYIKENTALVYDVNDVSVLLPTAREVRNTILTGKSGSWKFKQHHTQTVTRPNNEVVTTSTIVGDVWIALTDDMLYAMQQRITDHVQECFDWEARITTDINNATTVQALRDIDVTVTLSRD